MGKIVKFEFGPSEITTITDEKGDIWWVAKEVCVVLGLENVTEALRGLDDDEKQNIRITEVLKSRNPNTNIINEPGLYSLILRSRKPEAKTFKRWVTHEVLPSIRKTGSYGDPMKALNDPAAMRSLLLSYSEKVLELQPKADGFDRIANADDAVNVTEAAKALQMQPQRLFMWLKINRWIYKRAGGKNWLGYQDKVQQGLLTHKVTTLQRPDGTEKITEQVLVTPKGLAKLSVLITNNQLEGASCTTQKTRQSWTGPTTASSKATPGDSTIAFRSRAGRTAWRSR